MSAKRSATTELNHENWDQEDPSEHEEMGTFKTASKDILEKRVIRTAKRRSNLGSDEGKKGVFSGFGGFNKAQPSSFEFLSNLTNGNKTSSLPPSKSDSVTSSFFSNKSPISSSGGLFGKQPTSTNSTFGIPAQTTMFGVSSSNTPPVTSIFTASKADSTVGDSHSKPQPTSSTSEPSTLNTPKANNSNILASSLFGVSSTNANTTKSLFTNASNLSPFKAQPVSSSTTTQQNRLETSTSTVTKPSVDESKKESTNEEKKLSYYSKLKGLNESVSAWIRKHVEETPLCILSPVFVDYEKHLKEIQEQYQGPEQKSDKSNKSGSDDGNDKPVNITEESKTPVKALPTFSDYSPVSPAKADTSQSKLPIFGIQNNKPTLGDKPNFTFGIQQSKSTATSPTSGFTFGISTAQSTATTTTSLFSGSSSTTSNGGKPFSFGVGKPFSFSSNIQQPKTDTKENDNEEDDAPPKVEYTPIVEENSVYDTKCKIFVKKDNNFVDKGVGTLYIKKIEESGKHQLLVRANTNLGTVLLNFILATAIPTQRMGKNNVMMVCIPTPDSTPPPTPILIRVKTSEEADELLETLNKYKT